MTGDSNSRHLLVLSDDEDVRLVIQDLLEEEGYRVTHRPYLTGDTDEVLRSTPDGIVIDCNRKGLDESVAFLSTVREVPHLAGIPIIASTSAVRVIDQYQDVIDELAIHILRKPFDIELLAEVVASCFAENEDVTRAS